MSWMILQPGSKLLSVLFVTRTLALISLAVLLIGPRRDVRLSTWSIAAVDPATGDTGVAGASCVPEYMDAIAVIVPGKGAAAVQALWDLDNRNKVYELIRAGESAEAVLRSVTDRAYDNGVDDRQYGIIT